MPSVYIFCIEKNPVAASCRAKKMSDCGCISDIKIERIRHSTLLCVSGVVGSET